VWADILGRPMTYGPSCRLYQWIYHNTGTICVGWSDCSMFDELGVFGGRVFAIALVLFSLG
jgi:hypothetical protein